MQDKIKFYYIEAQVEITCVVCNETTIFFPNSDEEIVQCPKCERGFELNYSMNPVSSSKITKEKLKPYVTKHGIR